MAVTKIARFGARRRPSEPFYIFTYYSSTSLSLLTYIFHDLGPSPYLGDVLQAELVVEDLDDEVEDIVQDEDQGHRDAVYGVGPNVH